MHFPHRIRITRSVPHPDPELDDYGQPLEGFEDTTEVLYDGPADVQDRPALLIRDLAGDPTIDADTAVYLPDVVPPPRLSAAFAGLAAGDYEATVTAQNDLGYGAPATAPFAVGSPGGDSAEPAKQAEPGPTFAASFGTAGGESTLFAPAYGLTAADLFRLVENGDVVETPIGIGTVQGRRYLDRQLFIRLDH